MNTPVKRLEHARDEGRMSFGDHLEDLRSRIIKALLGVAVAMVLCFYFGDHIIRVLTTPYLVAMKDLGFEPRLVQINPLEAFIEYFKIAFEFSLVISAPWALYQIWLFIAVGLYPSEQRLVRRFAPASIGLFLLGAAFMVTVVLTGLMKFLIGVSMWFPLPSEDSWLFRLMSEKSSVLLQPATSRPAAEMNVPVLGEDPDHPDDGQVWINSRRHELSAFFGGQSFRVPMTPSKRDQFVQPFFSISEYLGFVVDLSLAFGLGFQIPIVVVFLIAVQIISAKALGGARKYVVLGVFILAAIITPTPDVGTMLLLAVPMLVLFEAGLLVGRMVERGREADTRTDTG